MYISIYCIPAASKGSPMDISTLLTGLHWAPLGSARLVHVPFPKRSNWLEDTNGEWRKSCCWRCLDARPSPV